MYLKYLLIVYLKYLIFKTFAVCLEYAPLVGSYCLTEYTFSIMKMSVYLKYMPKESEMSTTQSIIQALVAYFAQYTSSILRV